MGPDPARIERKFAGKRSAPQSFSPRRETLNATAEALPQQNAAEKKTLPSRQSWKRHLMQRHCVRTESFGRRPPLATVRYRLSCSSIRPSAHRSAACCPPACLRDGVRRKLWKDGEGEEGGGGAAAASVLCSSVRPSILRSVCPRARQSAQGSVACLPACLPSSSSSCHKWPSAFQSGPKLPPPLSYCCGIGQLPPPAAAAAPAAAALAPTLLLPLRTPRPSSSSSSSPAAAAAAALTPMPPLAAIFVHSLRRVSGVLACLVAWLAGGRANGWANWRDAFLPGG